jgi:hypothetical protein
MSETPQDQGPLDPGPLDPGPLDPGPLGPAAAAGAPPEPLPRAALAWSVGAVWALALVLGVLTALLSHPPQYASWLSLALGVCVIGAFGAQLATQRKDGFVNRLATTLTGSFVILGIFGAILGVITLGH